MSPFFIALRVRERERERERNIPETSVPMGSDSNQQSHTGQGGAVLESQVILSFLSASSRTLFNFRSFLINDPSPLGDRIFLTALPKPMLFLLILESLPRTLQSPLVTISPGSLPTLPNSTSYLCLHSSPSCSCLASASTPSAQALAPSHQTQGRSSSLLMGMVTPAPAPLQERCCYCAHCVSELFTLFSSDSLFPGVLCLFQALPLNPTTSGTLLPLSIWAAEVQQSRMTRLSKTSLKGR